MQGDGRSEFFQFRSAELRRRGWRRRGIVLGVRQARREQTERAQHGAEVLLYFHDEPPLLK
jgi:hypothetical protein